jgi:hypothetical protein
MSRSDKIFSANVNGFSPPLVTTAVQKQFHYHFYQCCGSAMSIPTPNFFHPRSASKKLKEQSILGPRFLCSRKYDPGVHPGSGSRIQILTFYPSRIPDPGVKKALDPGSATLISYIISILINIQNMTTNHKFEYFRN